MTLLFQKLLCISGSISVLCTAAAFPAFADDNNTFTDKTLTYEKISGGVRIVSAEAGTTEISVSSMIDGFPVLEIGETAFSSCAKLKKVTLPSGLKKIGTGAFSGCMALESVNIPDTVTEICDGAFYYCTAVTELSVPKSVTTIGRAAFSNCLSLEKVTLPDSLTALSERLFYYDISLEEITLPKDLTTIEQRSFEACYSLKSVNIPASVTTIEPAAFVGCSGILSYQIADGNQSYRTDDCGAIYSADGSTMLCYPAGREEKEYTVQAGTVSLAPYACSSSLYLETLNLPESVTQLGNGLFSDCQAVKSYVFPSNITAIPEGFFANSTVASVTIPENITQIGSFAFFGCDLLTDLTIPQSVTEIGDEAFFGCTALHELFVPETVQTIGEFAIGYYLPKDAENNNQIEQMSDFTLTVKPQTPAKEYAQENDIRFKQIGFDMQILLYIGIGAAAAACITLAVILILRGKKLKAEQAAAAPPEAPDPNYQSILDQSDEESPLT